MLTESRVIPMNSRTWEGRKVFLGAIGDVQFLKQGEYQHRAVAQREQGACWAMKESSKI